MSPGRLAPSVREMRPGAWRGLASVWTLAGCVWAAALIGAPMLVDAQVARAGVGPSGWTTGGAALVYGVGARICHQLPERSFHWHGVQLPVCARCTGLYLSLAIGLLAGWLGRPERSWRPAVVRTALAVSAIPIAATLVVEWLQWFAPGHLLRASSAVPVGLVLGWVLVVLLVRATPRPSQPAVAPSAIPLIH